MKKKIPIFITDHFLQLMKLTTLEENNRTEHSIILKAQFPTLNIIVDSLSIRWQIKSLHHFGRFLVWLISHGPVEHVH